MSSNNDGDTAIPNEDLRTAFDVLSPKILEELKAKPPTIGVIGCSGVGKSSTINRLFKTSLAVSDTVACTKEFVDQPIGLNFTKGPKKGSATQLVIVDAPGLGEDIERDTIYLNRYREELPKCDVILWLIAARNRAISLDQYYLRQLEGFHKRMVFGINQIDLVEPVDWNERFNVPSQQQSTSIDEITNDRKQKIESILRVNVKMVPYSSKYGFNLQQLFTTIITSCPPERAWIFDGLQGFEYTDFIPKEVLEDSRRKKSFIGRIFNQ